MAFAFRDSGIASFVSGAATLNDPTTGGINEGDLVYIYAICSSVAQPTINTPAGFTQIQNVPGVLSNQKQAAFFKVAGASEPASYSVSATSTFGSPSGRAHIRVYSVTGTPSLRTSASNTQPIQANSGISCNAGIPVGDSLAGELGIMAGHRESATITTYTAATGSFGNVLGDGQQIASASADRIFTANTDINTVTITPDGLTEGSGSIYALFEETGAANPDVDLSHYRWTDDDNAAHELTTFAAAEDTALDVDESTELDIGFNLIVKLGNEGAATQVDNFQLQYNKNGGGWNDVNASSLNVRSFNGLDTDGATSAVERLTTTPETYIGSVYDEVDGLITTDIPDGDGYELYFCVTFRSADVVSGDSIQFRILEGANTITQDVTPTANITGGGGPPPPFPPPAPARDPVKLKNIQLFNTEGFVFNVTTRAEGFIASDNLDDVIIKEGETADFIGSVIDSTKFERDP